MGKNLEIPTMDLKTIRDRQALAEYFHQNISLHAYSLGDLDDFYWPNVTCIGLESASGFDEVSVLYQGNGLPVLLAFSQEGKMNGKYFSQIFSLLPDQFYAHLSPKLEIHFSDIYQVKAILGTLLIPEWFLLSNILVIGRQRTWFVLAESMSIPGNTRLLSWGTSPPTRNSENADWEGGLPPQFAAHFMKR